MVFHHMNKSNFIYSFLSLSFRNAHCLLRFFYTTTTTVIIVIIVTTITTTTRRPISMKNHE